MVVNDIIMFLTWNTFLHVLDAVFFHCRQ